MLCKYKNNYSSELIECLPEVAKSNWAITTEANVNELIKQKVAVRILDGNSEHVAHA